MKSKNLFLVILLVVVCLAAGFSVKATSGACSSHGGVDCALGPSYDGTVTCNDYSNDSTVRFWDVTECNSSISDVLKNCPATGELQTQILNLVKQFYDLQTQESIELNNIVTNPQYSVRYAQSEQARVQKEYGEQLSSVYGSITSECQAASVQQTENWLNAQQITCPLNASLVGGSCSCNDGYVASGNFCITYTQSCQKQYGSNSYGDKNYCYCDSGYEWNSGRTVCVPVPSITCPTNSTNVNNQCVCNDGYTLVDNNCITYTHGCQNRFGINSQYINGQCACNDGYVLKNNSCITYTDDCIQIYGQNVYGVEGTSNNSTCYCDSGYEWNTAKTACVQSVNCPLNSTKVNNSCFCNTGYEWDSTKTACLKTETPQQVAGVVQGVQNEQTSIATSEGQTATTQEQVQKDNSQDKNLAQSNNQGAVKKEGGGFGNFFSSLVANIANAFKGFFGKIFGN